MIHRVTAIMSGAAPGAERGALDAAIELDLGHGGWAPDDGAGIPPIYLERMMRTDRDMAMLRRLNVQDSDGTLMVTFSGQLLGPAAYIGSQAQAQRKPAKHLVLPARGKTRVEPVRVAVLQWLADRRISVLNVAGPREDDEPGIQQATRDALVWLLEDESVEPEHYGHGRGQIMPLGCAHVAAACSECDARICMSCSEPLDLSTDAEIKTAVRWCREHAHLDPGRPG